MLASNRSILILSLAVGILAGTVSEAVSQNQRRSRTVPSDEYFVGFGAFYQGEFDEAARVFDSANRSGIRSTDGRWVDSVCYSTMLGECHFHMGNNALAIEHYNTALLLFVQHSNWMLSISPDSLGPIAPVNNDPRSTITWGSSSRNTLIGNYPEVVPVLQGNSPADNDRVLQRGGVLSTQQMLPVRASEIARCIALAIYRRQEILGPVSQYDGLTGQLVGILQRRPAPPNHWLGTWVDVQHGMALSAAGKTDEAIQVLQRSLTVAGQYDHPLTALALLQLGRIAYQQQQYNAALAYFQEASYAAAAFQQYQQVEDALKGVAKVALITEPGTMPATLAGMSQWRELRRFEVIRAELALAVAEAQAYMGNTAAASTALEEARRAMTRRAMGKGRTGIKFGYLSALIAFQAGSGASGLADLNSAVALNRGASTRLYQTELANQLFVSNAITERTAQLLFDELLREPTDADWISQPFETLTVLLTPNPTAMEHWFNTAILRKQPELALELADRIRRMRFFATLPLGGRMLALRWILEAPDAALDTKAKLQRQDLLDKFPELKVLQDEIAKLRSELAQLELQPEDKAFVQQRDLLKKMGNASDRLEVLLSAIALRRTPSQFLFPPLRTTADIREKLEDTQLVLSFFSTSRAVHAFLFTKKDYVHWTLENPKETKSKIGDLLKQIGLVKRDTSVHSQDLAKTDWQTTSAELLKTFIPSLKSGFWKNYSELVIVPDDVLWYVPFEALHADDGLGAGNTVPLVELIPVRYAPTAGLIVPGKPARPRPQKTAIVAGRLFLSDKTQTTQQHYDQVKDVFVGAGRIDRLPGGPSSLLAKVWDQMVVLDDSEDAHRGDVWGWSPAQVDRGKPGGDLGSWLKVPLVGPQVVYLPGFHSGAEEVLGSSASGNDIFVTSLGIMATGTETIVLSRWHSGGTASVSIVEGIGRRLDSQTASVAWQESIEEVRKRPLDGGTEPRLKGSDPNAPNTLDHPFFWADLMLIDTGIRPNR